MSSKLTSVKNIRRISQTFRQKGKSVVFTNGCFDILHAGHVTYLAQAKKFGDILIVGLNSDLSVRQIKGPDRPINSEKARALVLSALQMVDYVVIFNEPTPIKLIHAIKPDILVKGSDWAKKKVAGSEEVRAW